MARYTLKTVVMDIPSQTLIEEVIEEIDTDDDPDYAHCRRESPTNCVVIASTYESKKNFWLHSHGKITKVIDLRRIS